MSTTTITAKIKREDVRLALFPSFKEYEKADLLFSEDKEFEKIPLEDSPLPLSLIMTTEGISLLKMKGIKIFRVAEPIAIEDITRQQREFLEANKAVWVHSYFLGIVDVTFFMERVYVGVDKEGRYVKTK